MDAYEQAVIDQNRPISAVARQGYRESGRGIVALTLAPDGPILRYASLKDNRGKAGPLEPSLKMAEQYNPKTTAVVHVLKAGNGHDESVCCMFTSLGAEESLADLPGAIRFKKGTPHDAPRMTGEDQSFIARNQDFLAELAKLGFRSKGQGAVVILRDDVEEAHWTKGHLAGLLPADEGCKAFYVPLHRLVEGPVNNLDSVRKYDPEKEAVFIFLRSGKAAMTYQIGIT